MAANNALKQVTEMAVVMQEKTQGDSSASVLKRSARRLQASMYGAEEAVDEQILLGTKLVSLSSYLTITLADSDQAQASQANEIQVTVGAEIKPLRKNIDKLYDEYASLFDMAGEASSSQASSVSSSRANIVYNSISGLTPFTHFRGVELAGKWSFLCDVVFIFRLFSF